MTHKDGVICSGCEDKLKQSHKYLSDWFHEIKQKWNDVHISWSYRGQEDQEKAFSEGKSNAHYPKSPHNNCDSDGKPCSLALDLFQQVNGKLVYDNSFFHDLNQWNLENDKDIIWGGNFKSLGDKDHFQYHEKS